MVAPQRPSPRAGPAPWPRMAHSARSHQLFSVCLLGGGGMDTGVPSFHTQDRHPPGKELLAAHVSQVSGTLAWHSPRPWEGTEDAGWCSPFTLLGKGVQRRASQAPLVNAVHAP